MALYKCVFFVSCACACSFGQVPAGFSNQVAVDDSMYNIYMCERPMTLHHRHQTMVAHLLMCSPIYKDQESQKLCWMNSTKPMFCWSISALPSSLVLLDICIMNNEICLQKGFSSTTCVHNVC